MEVAVEGEDIPPDELQKDGWKHIHHVHRENAAAKKKIAETTNSTAGADHATKQHRPRPRRRVPPPEKLPEEDFKIVFRPHGGLNVRTTSQADILDAVYKAAGLSYLQGEQLRTNVTSNYFIFNTPSEERCSVIALIQHINIRGQTFEVATNVAAPSRTAIGIIFNVPIDDTPEVITESLVRFNPTCNILTARRMGNSNAVQILFDGTIIPYHISYRGATYRCQPFRRKTEACTTCWRTGHRPDVCPTSQVRCQKCGLLNPNPEHPCQPKCVVCKGIHITGSAECRSRFQPRRRPPPLNKQQHLPWQQPPPPPPPPVPGCPQDWPGLPERGDRSRSNSSANKKGRSTSKEDEETQPPPPPTQPNNKQVSWGSATSHPPQSQHQTHNLSTAHAHELASMRAEIEALKQSMLKLKNDNLALHKENQALRNSLSQATHTAEAETNSPPIKKRVVETPVTKEVTSKLTDHDEKLDVINNRLNGLEQTLESKFHDIDTKLHNTMELLNNIMKGIESPQHVPTDTPQQSPAPHVERGRNKPYR